MAMFGMNQFDPFWPPAGTEFDPFLSPRDPQYPSPLPPSRQIELVRTRVEMVGRCAACLRSTGILTCSRCWAVMYCSKDCQRIGGLLDRKRGWKDHKDVCKKIETLSKDVEAAAKVVATNFGGTETFFKTQLVKKGLFNYIEEYDDTIEAKNANDKYILARGRLIRAYKKCGVTSLSSLAFRLAAENMLDLLCLTYYTADGEHVRFQYCGWMVAGGMNQEALNYLCYFRHRQLSTVAIPYLDLSQDEDIEGDSYLEMLRTPKNRFDCSTLQWFHDYMLIALIKYKRLQELFVQKQKDEAGWKTFLMGTHECVGENSVVLMLRGKTLVTKKIESCVLCDNLGPRLDELAGQIQKILTAVNQRNPLIIPGILDRNSIPHEPKYDEKEDVDEDSDDGIDQGDVDDIHDAGCAYGNYASAWYMSPAYTRVLQLFLDTGKVTAGFLGKEGSIPVEGFLQAAFDVDPSRFFGHKDDLFIGIASI